MSRNTIMRSMHDLGLAAWFGGSLMGAVGLNAAAGVVTDARQRSEVANAGWDRWTPVNAAAIGAHLLGGAGVLAANRDRLVAQRGVGAMTAVKTLLTGVALATTALARAEGRKVSDRSGVPVASGAVNILLVVVILLATGILIGVAGSYFSVRRFLKV